MAEVFRRINHAWRVIATAASFAAFGGGGVVLGALLSLFYIAGGRDGRHQRLARRCVQKSFAAHLELMRLLGVMTYEFRGEHRLQRDGLLILANHPTLIDVVCLISRIPNADCVVKQAVASNPFMRGPVRAAGYVSNEHGAGLIDDCIRAIRTGSSLVIFPEGTRSVPGQPLKLQRGAANIAVRGGVDITPVRISCKPATLVKGQKWYNVPRRKFHILVEVGEDISISSFVRDGAESFGDPIAARRLTDHLARYFQESGESASAAT